MLPPELCRLQVVAALRFSAPVRRDRTTIYVGKHFEVRDHDAPVKYVFSGNTRVARVTGSLSANERIQKLRLRAGSNKSVGSVPHISTFH